MSRLAPLLLLPLLACGGSPTSNLVPPPPPPPNAVATVVIKQAPQAPLEAGSTAQLAAEARNAAGEPVSGRTFAWRSSAPGVATVSSLGRVTAVQQGTATITATSGEVSGSVELSVVPPAIVSLAVFPATLAVAPGGSAQFTASAIGNHGTVPGVAVAWSSSNPAIAAVDGTGRVTGVAPGTALIEARVGGVTRTRGVTVSDASLNFWVHRADLIQIAQTSQGDVPLVRGKPAAVRIFPAGTQAGWQDIAMDVRLDRGGATVFSTRVPSGIVSVSPSTLDPQQGVIVPLPPQLDVDGTALHVTIDPDDLHAERDEWDNTAPVVGSDASPFATVAVPTLRIRLVPLAPAGATPPSLFPADAQAIAAFLRTVYPASSVEVSVRGASIVTAFPWPDRQTLSDALAVVEVERVADGFDGHYYGVHDQGAVNGIVGLGYLTARSSLGTADGVVFAHEVGHNMGLAHPPGCGADGANTGYPYPNGQIGIRGYDPRTQAVVPATAIDMMGYCGGIKWISGGYFSGILSVLRNRSPGTLRAPQGDEVPFAIRATWGGVASGVREARRLPATAGRSEATGEVQVQAVDSTGQVLATTALPRLQVADVGDEAIRVAGVVTVPSALAPRVTAFWLTANGNSVAVAVDE